MEAPDMNDNKVDTDIANLLVCWRDVVQNDTRPYGYEVFVRLGNLLHDQPDRDLREYPGDEFRILPRVMQNQRSDESGYPLFAELWNESRKRVNSRP
jgi:hypothetical protein